MKNCRPRLYFFVNFLGLVYLKLGLKNRWGGLISKSGFKSQTNTLQWTSGQQKNHENLSRVWKYYNMPGPIAFECYPAPTAWPISTGSPPRRTSSDHHYYETRPLLSHCEVLSEEPCESVSGGARERRDDGNWCVYSVYRELAVGAAASSRPNEAHSSFSAG